MKPKFYTIDIGNSHTKIFARTITTSLIKMSTDELLNEATPNDVIVFSSVLSKEKCFSQNPELAKILYAGNNPFQTIDSSHYRIKNTYLDMKSEYTLTLGTDRLIQSRFLYEELSQFKNSIEKCLLIDAGTMVTFDLVSKRLGHLGGIIAPGLRTFSNCFARGDQLPEAEKILAEFASYDTKNALNIPNSTETAITTSYWSSLLAYLSLFVQKWGIEKIILTGGHGEVWSNQIKNCFEFNEFSNLKNCILDSRQHFIHESLFWLGNKIILGQIK